MEQQNPNKTLVLDLEVVNQLIGYATQRPYKEVAVLLSNLQQSIDRNNKSEAPKQDEKAVS